MHGKQIIDSYVVGKVVTKGSSWKQKIIDDIHPLVLSPISERCSVKLEFYMHEHRLLENDIDNLCKLVLDSLTSARLFRDDTCVDNLEATKIPININDPEGVHIEVWEWIPEYESP
jgi:Holliday junction resolvase RusA-like endonuclease